MVDNYLRRIEALETELVEAPVEQGAVAYLHDSDARPADRMTMRGQRFDRGADQGVDDFRRRVLESLGLAARNVIVVRYVGSDGNGGRRFPDAA
jgi:hypothetical protein